MEKRATRATPSTGNAKKKRVSKKKRVKKKASQLDVISNRFISIVCKRLAANARVRRTLPGRGRLHIDRQLPFLCVYRRPAGADDTRTERLVTGEAAYLLASAEPKYHKGLEALVAGVAKTMVDAFGAFLLLEIWADPDESVEQGQVPSHTPAFHIVRTKKSARISTVESFERALGEIEVHDVKAQVVTTTATNARPPGRRSLMQASLVTELGCQVLGVGVRPIYRDAKTRQDYPLIFRGLKRGLSHAFKRGFFEFTRKHTTHRPRHFHSLGRRAMTKVVWAVDAQLADVSNSFDFLLSITPINASAAWSQFERARFKTAPEFAYRPLPIDPSRLKRALFKVPIERVDDPTLAQLFRDQQLELDRKLSMLSDRGTKNFLYGSLQLFGAVDPALLAAAEEVLDRVPSRSRNSSGVVDAKTFAARANEEIDYFRLTHPDVNSTAQVRSDVVGLIVSRGSLLIGAQTRVPVTRVAAAIAHEVGTHVLTYFNGRAQPFRQLYVGLPGYEELQEGLAVLSEYLVGGLNRARLRLLAARVVAAHRLVQGASFVDVFGELDNTLQFDQRTAFNITMRIFRGGGLTKDAVYLRGLIQLIEYLKGGGLLEPLFIGKLALEHVPIMQELQLRHVLGPPPLRPRHLEDPKSAERLDRVRQGISIPDLVSEKRA